MKNKKVIMLAIGIPIILLFIFTFSLCEASDKLQIKIWTDKDQFFEREPILVHYEIKNISDSSLMISSWKAQEYLVVKDQHAKSYGSRLKGLILGEILRAGETIQGTVDLVDRYSIESVGEYSCYMHHPPDSYTYPPKYAWTKSNTIKIKVIEPERENKKALKMYLKAESIGWVKDKDPEKRELRFLKFQEVADKYPNSIYAPKALNSASLVYLYSRNLEERRKIIPVCKRLIEEYPNSYYFVWGFSDLVGTYEILKDKEGAIKTMQELIKKYPKTKISEKAEYWLEKIEKWEFK